MKYLLLVTILGFVSTPGSVFAVDWPATHLQWLTMEEQYRCQWLPAAENEQQEQHGGSESEEDEEPDCE